ncbi:MAG: hypothetical protein L0J80_02500 [Lactococcus sp.]|nr:hypothetical protein [Lactococcus sp.]
MEESEAYDINVLRKNELRLIALSTHDKLTKELALSFLEESEGVAHDELSQTCWCDCLYDLRTEIKIRLNISYMTTIVIGTTVVDYKTMEVDTPPSPEHDSVHYRDISGEGMVFSGEKYDDGHRFQSGVIESHYCTADWQLVLSTYKKWLTDKEKTFSYLFVLLGGELVHHEINASNLIWG